MDTLKRPELRPGRTGRSEIVGSVLLALGFVLMVLGIFEVGGPFAIACGLVTIHVGEVVIFAAERGWYVEDLGYAMPPIDRPRD